MKKKILIIEDDGIVAHIYRSRLEKEGFEVKVATDGQAGHQQLNEWKPQALLLDLMLPKLNGLDLLKKIRATREFGSMPIVVFTNAYVGNMIHEAVAAGASAVYNKSNVTPKQIIDVITTFLAEPTPSAPSNATGTATPATAPAEAKAAPINHTCDSSFQKDLSTTFAAASVGALNEMRKLLQETSKADEKTRATHMDQLYRKVRSFSANAGMAALPHFAKMAAAVEVLMKELVEKPKTITPSTMRTVAHAIDFFTELSKPGVPADLADNPPIDILIVDDEVLSRRALIFALEKAFLKPVAVEDAEAALVKVKNAKFDLVFLDVNMPGMDGFQLCDRLRASGLNQTTPVIFVTATTDFQVRAQSMLRGASDLIAKPFMFIELTVKALTFALRHRLENQKQSRPAPALHCVAEAVPVTN
jgi:CheY-like chemotaxis protein